MTATTLRVLLGVLGGGLLLLAVLERGDLFACNASPSMPRGCYQIAHRQPLVGEFAVACPPLPMVKLALARGYLDRGRCGGGSARLLKVVVGAEGDAVEVLPQGVAVNGRVWPLSAPREQDRKGRVLPSVSSAWPRLDEGQVMLLSLDYPLGFDGRYWGPTDRSLVVGTAVPVWLWD